MAKFKDMEHVVPNNKAPLYLKSRRDRGNQFRIDYIIGNGYYNIEDLTTGETFKVASQFLDSVKVEGVNEAVENLRSNPTEKKVEECTKETTEEGTELSKNVKEFVEFNSNKIEELRKPIDKIMDEIRDRAIINGIAIELNLIPSPKVYKFMIKLSELHTDLSELTIAELYKKAESILADFES